MSPSLPGVLVAVSVLACMVSASPSKFPPLDVLRPFVSPANQAAAVEALLNRLLAPKQAAQFNIVVNPNITDFNNDRVLIEPKEVNTHGSPIIQITGNTGVSAAYGVSQYLRACCNAHFSWDGNQLASLPKVLPMPKEKSQYNSNGRFRYFGNICTPSYSMAFWNFSRWEKHIDWMALNGINMPLAVTGQELIWQRVFQKFGLTIDEINDYFTGPAFFAWNRMGNLKRWGGPLSQAYMKQQLKLQKQILQREVSLGMVPVLPGFAGHVPGALAKHYPNANISYLHWSSFNCTYTCTGFLDPREQLFVNISAAFINEMKTAYGRFYHAYNADPFNEMTPPSYKPDYIKPVVENIFRGMQTADTSSIWVMQAWFLVSGGHWYDPGGIQALFGNIEKGRMLVLDLYAEQSPVYSRTSSFMGQPFTWDLLHNFGGTLGMYGATEKVNEGISAAQSYPGSTMVGTGLTMEGIFQNYPMYQLLIDRSWAPKPLNLSEWFEDFSVQRYGRANTAAQQGWQTLFKSAYSFGGGSPNSYILTDRPQLGLGQAVIYKWVDFCSAWNSFIQAASKPEMNTFLFRLDLVDITREALQSIFALYYKNATEAYGKKDMASLKAYSSLSLSLLNEMDTILNTHPNFRLLPWEADARNDATSPTEANLWNYNVRNQITLWGPTGQILDYARKQWSDVVSHYYLPRWQLFFGQLQNSLKTGKKFNQTQFNSDVLSKVELPFQTMKITPKAPKETIEVADAIYANYRWTCSHQHDAFEKLAKGFILPEMIRYGR